MSRAVISAERLLPEAQRASLPALIRLRGLPSRVTFTGAFRVVWTSVLKLRTPFGRPFGLPDWPGLKRVCSVACRNRLVVALTVLTIESFLIAHELVCLDQVRLIITSAQIVNRPLRGWARGSVLFDFFERETAFGVQRLDAGELAEAA